MSNSNGHAKTIPYVTSSWNKIEAMLELAHPEKGQTVADLGSGDGRIVVEFAKHGAEAHGFEISEELVENSKNTIIEEDLTGNAFIHHSDFWNEDLSEFDIVIIYGMPDVLEKLENKLEKELKPGAKVISSIYALPNWKATQVKDNVYLYEAPSS